MCEWLKETLMNGGFQWEWQLAMLVRAKAVEKGVILFLWGIQTTLEAEAGRLIQCLLRGTHKLIAQVMYCTAEDGSLSQ